EHIHFKAHELLCNLVKYNFGNIESPKIETYDQLKDLTIHMRTNSEHSLKIFGNTISSLLANEFPEMASNLFMLTFERIDTIKKKERRMWTVQCEYISNLNNF